MLVYQPRILKCQLPQAGIAIGGRVVSSGQVHLQQDLLAIGHGRTEHLRPLPTRRVETHVGE